MSRTPETPPPTTLTVVASERNPLDPGVFRSLLDRLEDGLCFVDLDHRIVYWNAGAERITGFDGDEVRGRSCHTSLHRGVLCTNAPGECANACALAIAIATNAPVHARSHRLHRDGRRLLLQVQAVPVHDEHGQLIGGVELFRDASATAALELACGHLRILAETDHLTGTASRRHLDTLLDRQLALLCQVGVPFSVILADLDHFKQINDTWGHSVGDQVLQAFARGLQGQCRAGEFVGRFGGEEFLIILPGARLADALEVAERMRAVTPLAAPPGLDALRPTCSFGVAEARPTDTPGQILRRVDAALYRAKSRGRQRVEPQSGEVASQA